MERKINDCKCGWKPYKYKLEPTFRLFCSACSIGTEWHESLDRAIYIWNKANPTLQEIRLKKLKKLKDGK